MSEICINLSLTDSEQPGNYNQWVSKKGLGKKICELDALGSADGFSDLSEGSWALNWPCSKKHRKGFVPLTFTEEASKSGASDVAIQRSGYLSSDCKQKEHFLECVEGCISNIERYTFVISKGWLSVNVNKQSTSIYFNMNPTFQLCLWGKGKMESMMRGACSFLWHAGQNFHGSSMVFAGKKHLAGYEGVGCMDVAGQHDTDRGSTLVKICDLWEFSIIQHMKVLHPMGPSTAYHRGGRCNVIFNLMMHGGQLLSVSLCRLWVKISHLKHLREEDFMPFLANLWFWPIW